MAFPLERGVWQGDPLSPLLFALSSQPLMSLLQEQRRVGAITGLYISEHESLIYQLFADDAGLFLRNTQAEFEATRKTIQVFEDISGAYLNVAKSVIVPLVNPEPQVWFNRIGCQVLGPSDTTKYLGCLIGYNVTPTQETYFLLGKVSK